MTEFVPLEDVGEQNEAKERELNCELCGEQVDRRVQENESYHPGGFNRAGSTRVCVVDGVAYIHFSTTEGANYD